MRQKAHVNLQLSCRAAPSSSTAHWIAAMQPCCPKTPRANHDIYFGRYFWAWALVQEFAPRMAGNWAARSGGTPFPEVIRGGEKVCPLLRDFLTEGRTFWATQAAGPKCSCRHSKVSLLLGSSAFIDTEGTKHKDADSQVLHGPRSRPKSLSQGYTAESSSHE